METTPQAIVLQTINTEHVWWAHDSDLRPRFGVRRNTWILPTLNYVRSTVVTMWYRHLKLTRVSRVSLDWTWSQLQLFNSVRRPIGTHSTMKRTETPVHFEPRSDALRIARRESLGTMTDSTNCTARFTGGRQAVSRAAIAVFALMACCTVAAAIDQSIATASAEGGVQEKAAGADIAPEVTIEENLSGQSTVWDSRDCGIELRNPVILSGNNSGAFELSPTDGILRVLDPGMLDYETLQKHQLVIGATIGVDDEDPFRASFAASAVEAGATGDDVRQLFEKQIEFPVTVQLQDVNEAPRLAFHEFAVSELCLPNSRIGTVRAIDPDSDDSPHYSVASGNEDAFFTIDSETGDIFVTDPGGLDFEQRQSMNLTIEARDSGALISTNTLRVVIRDVDEPPIIVNDQQLQWTILAGTDNSLGAITAIDPESAGALTYSLLHDPTDGGFTIDQFDGHVEVANRQRFEGLGGEQVTLMVSVADASNNSTTIPVQVSVPDQYSLPVAQRIASPPTILQVLGGMSFPLGLCSFAGATWLMAVRTVRRRKRKAFRDRMLANALGSGRLAAPLVAEPTTPAPDDDDPVDETIPDETIPDENERDIEAAFSVREIAAEGEPKPTQDATTPEPPRQGGSTPSTVLSDTFLADLVSGTSAAADHDPAKPTKNPMTPQPNPVNDVAPILDAIGAAQTGTSTPTAATTAPDAELAAVAAGRGTPSADGDALEGQLVQDSQAEAQPSSHEMLNEAEQPDDEPQWDNEVIAHGSDDATEQSDHSDAEDDVHSEAVSSAAETQGDSEHRNHVPGKSLLSQIAVAEEPPVTSEDESLPNLDSLKVTLIKERVAGKPDATGTQDGADTNAGTDGPSEEDLSLSRYLANLFANTPGAKSKGGSTDSQEGGSDDFKPTSFIESYMQTENELGDEAAGTADASSPHAHGVVVRNKGVAKIDLEELRTRTVSFREISKIAAHSAVETSLVRQARAAVGQRTLVAAVLASCSIGLVAASAMNVLTFGSVGTLLSLAAVLAAGELCLCHRRLRKSERSLAQGGEPTNDATDTDC
jgi:Cadherin domain